MVQSTLYVNPQTGKDTGTGNAQSPFKTLTRALTTASSGTTIQLSAGTYNAAGGEVFPLVVPTGVMVLGHEPSKGKGIVIVGSGKYNSPTFNAQNITLRLESKAQLRGVTVTNPVEKGTAVWVESTAPMVTNNTFTGCGREGVFVTGTGKPLILDNIFIQNASSGVFLVRNAKGEVRRNLCQKTGYGIAISDSAAPLVTDNNLVSNHSGIFLSRGARPVLRRNLIEKNTHGGLVITGESKPDLGSTQDPAGNILRDNGQVDLQNSTSLTLVSVGNQLNPARVSGPVTLGSAQVPTAMTGPALFSDLGNHWGAAFIQGLVTRGLILGFPDGTFKPEASITRAEYAAILAKTFDLPRQRGTGAGVFSDVPANFWASSAIRVAAGMGFISGFPDGTFRPQQNLTRVQALVSLVSGLGLGSGNANLLVFYSDRAQIPSYATEAIATATQQRLVVNYPKTNQLEPMRNITRAEIAALIYQALVSTGRAEAIASPYIVSPNLSLPSFSDIQQHWASEFVRRLANLNLVTGFADGSFKPDEPLSRAQYAALVVKVFNPTAIRPDTKFIDIPADFWALPVISQAYRGGFLSGYPDQTFHPQQSLRRIDLMASLVHGLSLPSADVKVLEIYEDHDSIPAYAKSAVAAATQAGIVVNYPNPKLLQLKQDASRALAIAFMYQALVRTGRVVASNSPYIVSGSTQPN
ncbi:S-layer homology domain-containing protein [Microcoleus sp. FACHB-53]|nr:S-layer homology domain-containing protein [Microcoleus sp. FACHB-53]MBD2125613.1 S-layer homology domain-containing protein [Microcoleus sp. FACHB-1]